VVTVCRVQVPLEAIWGYVQTWDSVDTTLARGDFNFRCRTWCIGVTMVLPAYKVEAIQINSNSWL